MRALKITASVLHPAPICLEVVVPCYNPPEGWEEVLAGKFAEFQSAVSDLVAETRLIVVNDGSARHVSASNVRRLEALLPEARVVGYTANRGKGHALRYGVQASEAELVLVTDIDFPYTIASMRRITETLCAQGGIAAGNRDTAYYATVPASRRRLSQGLRWLLRNVLRQPIDDSQCGLKGFDHAGKAVFLETTIDRFLYDLEFLMLAGGRVPVYPVPVELRPGVVFSKVNWKILATEGRNFLQLFVRQLFRPQSPS